MCRFTDGVPGFYCPVFEGTNHFCTPLLVAPWCSQPGRRGKPDGPCRAPNPPATLVEEAALLVAGVDKDTRAATGKKVPVARAVRTVEASVARAQRKRPAHVAAHKPAAEPAEAAAAGAAADPAAGVAPEAPEPAGAAPALQPGALARARAAQRTERLAALREHVLEQGEKASVANKGQAINKA